jgi:eukaryotic-like serine/threonine-protein kinase
MSRDPFGLVGSTIGGRYVVEAVVGEGGFSVVYRARHTLWDRRVAIKAIRGVEALEAEARDKLLHAFVQEGAMLAELSERTTAIVQARDAATLVTANGDWVPYLVLEWLEGETLEAVLWHERQAGAPARSFVEAIRLLDPIAHALALAHAKGICHRDLKPGNVVLLGDARSRACRIKLLDFGVGASFGDTRWAAAHAVPSSEDPCGFTPSYGAPEQFSEAYGITGPWTDVFALALLVLELVTGREPMGGSKADELAAVAVDPKRRPTPRALGVPVPARLEAVMARAVAVYPAERWQTVGSFWSALCDAMVAPQSGARVAPTAHLAATAAGVLAGILALSVASDRSVPPTRESPGAREVTAAARAER